MTTGRRDHLRVLAQRVRWLMVARSESWARKPNFCGLLSLLQA